jgi:hypothetical protein
MHTFPGVAWDAWPDLPYDLVMSCINLIDGADDDGQE